MSEGTGLMKTPREVCISINSKDYFLLFTQSFQEKQVNKK